MLFKELKLKFQTITAEPAPLEFQHVHRFLSSLEVEDDIENKDIRYSSFLEYLKLNHIKDEFLKLDTPYAKLFSEWELSDSSASKDSKIVTLDEQLKSVRQKQSRIFLKKQNLRFEELLRELNILLEPLNVFSSQYPLPNSSKEIYETGQQSDFYHTAVIELQPQLKVFLKNLIVFLKKFYTGDTHDLDVYFDKKEYDNMAECFLANAIKNSMVPPHKITHFRLLKNYLINLLLNIRDVESSMAYVIDHINARHSLRKSHDDIVLEKTLTILKSSVASTTCVEAILSDHTDTPTKSSALDTGETPLSTLNISAPVSSQHPLLIREILQNLFSRLSFRALIRVQRVNKAWRALARNNLFWNILGLGQKTEVEEKYSKAILHLKSLTPDMQRIVLSRPSHDADKLHQMFALLALDQARRLEHFQKICSSLPSNAPQNIAVVRVAHQHQLQASSLSTNYGIAATSLGLLTVEQAIEQPMLLTTYGLLALSEGLITYHQVKTVVFIYTNGWSILLSDLGLQALRKGLFTVEQASKILHLDVLISKYGLIALSEGLITPEQASKLKKLYQDTRRQVPSLSLLLTKTGIEALREKLIDVDEIDDILSLSSILSERGIDALRSKKIIVKQISKLNDNQLLALISDEGQQAVKNHLITPEQMSIFTYWLEDKIKYGLRALNENLLTLEQLKNIKDSSLFSDRGLQALREGLITVDSFSNDVRITSGMGCGLNLSALFASDYGLIALRENLITVQQARVIQGLCNLLTEVGLQALREKLITPEQASQIYHRGTGGYCSHLSHLLTPNALKALRERLITPEQAVKIQDLNILMSDLGLEALREKLITPEQASQIYHRGMLGYCSSLGPLISQSGLQALRNKLITPEQVVKISDLGALLTAEGIKALKLKLITPEEVMKFNMRGELANHIRKLLADYEKSSINNTSSKLSPHP